MSTPARTGKKSQRKPGTGTYVRPARKVAQLATQGQAAEQPAAKKPRRPPQQIDGDAERIERFADHYLVHLNQSEAYKAAGFTRATSAKSIASLATTFMRRPEVVECIRRKKQERADAEAAKGGGALTREKVLGILNKMLDHDPRRMYNADGTLKAPHEMDDSAAMVLTAFEQDTTYLPQGPKADGDLAKVVTRKVKTSGRDAPLTLAMRHLGMLDDKLRLVVSGSVKKYDMAALAVLTDEELEQLERITAKLQGAGSPAANSEGEQQ